MVKRYLVTVVVLLGLILALAFTSWTQNTSPLLPVSSSPPDLTNYARTAIPGDLAPSMTSKALSSKPALSTNGASAAPGFFVVEVPNSGGGEPDIAINPLNLNQIVIHAGFGGWNGNAADFVSNNGGISWITSNQIPPPPGAGGTGGCPCDTAEDYGLDGNLYGSFLTFSPTDVFSASNTTPLTGGLFNYFLVGPNAQMTDFNGTAGSADQPQLLTDVDPTTPGQTNTYVAYDDDGTNNVRVSAALGTQPPNFVADNVSGVFFGGGINQGHRIAVDPRTGAIYSLYQGCLLNCGGSPKTIGYILNRSLDAGTTWTLNGSGTGIQVATGVTVQPQPKFGTVNALLGGIDHAAVDPTTSDVFVVYGDSNGSGGNAIFIRQITFDNSTPTKAVVGAAHQVSLAGAQAALPSVAVAPNGTVGVLYTSFDGFDVSGFPIFSGHFAFSADAGATFNDQNLLTFLSPAMNNGNARQRVLGDYQRLKVVNTPPPPANAGATFYGVFTGNGAALGDPIASNQAIFFKVTLAPQINLNKNPISIGNVCGGSAGQAQLQVSDTGADNLTVSSITQTSGSTDISVAAGPTYPVNISPGADFNFAFNCKPTTAGAKSATFTIASNDPANPNTVVTATCNRGSGSIAITGSGNFGTASCSGTTPPQTLQINNVGQCTLNVTSALISCADFTLVNPAEFPAPISPDSSLPLGINFTPTSAGPKSCNLTLTTDDPLNPTVVIPLSGTTSLGSASLTVPAGITFPPTVIQQDAACPALMGVPITNAGTCPVKINAVTLTQTSSPLDYSLTGVPGLPVMLAAGGQLGSGDLDLDFEPFTVARESTGMASVTFVNDPITGATSTDQVPFCGEAVLRGVRVLVTLGGVPVSTPVRRIRLQWALGPQQPNPHFITVQAIKNASLQTVTGTPPCASFQFHAEFGGVSNPLQLKLGTYRIKVALKVGNKTKHQIVRFTMDQCSFTPNIVVAF
jgi:hypothetical protein